MNIDTQILNDNFKHTAYTIRSKISEGGFGQIFLATNKITQQDVVLKLFTQCHTDSAFSAERSTLQYQQEVELVKKLDHPNIARLLDVGCTANTHFTVYEHVQGHTLKEHLNLNGALNVSVAVAIMADVLDALCHMHKNNILHNDIKPSNIMLGFTGAKPFVKVIDFGAATLFSTHAVSNNQDYSKSKLQIPAKKTIGTPAYCAPERLQGDSATFQSDIYTWGLVFLECLTGRPAVEGACVEDIFHKQLSLDPITLPAHIKNHALATLLEHTLAKNIHLRCRSALQLFHQLAQLDVSKLNPQKNSEDSYLPHPTLNSGQPSSTLDENKTLEWDAALMPRASAEIRQITVLALTLTIKNFNPNAVETETTDAFFRDQLNQCIDIATHTYGFHVGCLGDTLLFYFGYPQSRQHDLYYAINTVFNIFSSARKRNALLTQNNTFSLKLRAGIHTGLMHIYPSYVPVGATANIAMQLARFAHEDTILCNQRTKHFLGDLAKFEALENISSLIEQDLGAQFGTVYSLTAEAQIHQLKPLSNTDNSYSLNPRDPHPVEIANKRNSHLIETNIELHSLNQKGASDYLQHLLGYQIPSAELSNSILALTNKTPLFIDQLLWIAQQNGWLHTLNGVLDYLSPELAAKLPQTLIEAVQLRLSTATSAKVVLQTAANIGDAFDYKQLQAHTSTSEERLQIAIHELIHYGIFKIQRRADDDRLFFAHPIIRTVALQMQTETIEALLIYQHQKISKTINSAPLFNFSVTEKKMRTC